MNQFVNGAFNVRDSKTTNGMETFSTSLDPIVDLFYMIGASRGKDISRVFDKALRTDVDKTIRTLLWARDIRGGAGERQTFRDLYTYLIASQFEGIKSIAAMIPELGRWDDLLVTDDEDYLREIAFPLIHRALTDGNGLCAKWMPRKGDFAVALRNYIGASPKKYRKILVALSKTVEQQMCAKEWEDINFEHVPSVASARYQKAFGRNCPHYAEYIESLEKGTAKVNASAIFPHDVLKASNATVAQAQWDAIPFTDELSGVVPMVDVSGSMYHNAGNDSATCMEIAIAMGMFLSTHQNGAFKDLVMTFSQNPSFHKLVGKTIFDKKRGLSRVDWGMNTNIEKAFDSILRVALENKVSSEDMPKALVIFSDMEFDSCTRGVDNHLMTSMKKKFKKNGYDLPGVVFWNLHARVGNVPVRKHESGVALVSGYSPSIMKAIMESGFKSMSPEKVMLNAIMNERYNWNGGDNV